MAWQVRAFHAQLKAYFPEQRAYVNYIDAELPAWPVAYWGDNLARLEQVT